MQYPTPDPTEISNMKEMVTSLVCGLFLLSHVCFGNPVDLERPNFVVILCDDLGWGDLRCFGHPTIETPNLDKLATEGIRFTNAYAASVVCSPSRVGLMTGRNPVRAGIFDWIPEAKQVNSATNSRHLVHMRRDEITLPQLLKKAGYATAMAGKWHCNSAFNSPEQPQPGDAGFDHWFATQNNAAPSHKNPKNFVKDGTEVGALEGFSCQLVVRDAIAWLDKQQAATQRAATQQPAKPRQPFFLYVALHEPHEPVASPPELVAKYLPSAKNEDEAQFFANVENMDRAVGEFCVALKRLKLDENTVIFFSSDNGPETLSRYPAAKRSYGRPGTLRGMKLWTTEGGCRVPGIMRWPAKIKPGQTLDQPVCSLDLLPTFCSLAGASLPPQRALDGTNIAALLQGSKFERERPLMWVYFNALNEQRVAMRDGDWKLLARIGDTLAPQANITHRNESSIRSATLSGFSLYNLRLDPNETNDMALKESSVLASLRSKMEAGYQDLLKDMHVWPDQPNPLAASEDAKK
ncbi:MAG: sulfatase-like hydrolase/transferase [Pirellula sp.]